LSVSAVAEFPTQHAQLSHTFRNSEKSVRTDWLNKFVTDGAAQYATSIDAKKLAHFWAGAISKHEVSTHLAGFAEALLKGKALRNENN
jgi:hypothetical protein